MRYARMPLLPYRSLIPLPNWVSTRVEIQRKDATPCGLGWQAAVFCLLPLSPSSAFAPVPFPAFGFAHRGNDLSFLWTMIPMHSHAGYRYSPWSPLCPFS